MRPRAFVYSLLLVSTSQYLLRSATVIGDSLNILSVPNAKSSHPYVAEDDPAPLELPEGP